MACSGRSARFSEIQAKALDMCKSQHGAIMLCYCMSCHDLRSIVGKLPSEDSELEKWLRSVLWSKPSADQS